MGGADTLLVSEESFCNFVFWNRLIFADVISLIIIIIITIVIVTNIIIIITIANHSHEHNLIY